MIWTAESKFRIWERLCGTKADANTVSVCLLSNTGEVDWRCSSICSSLFCFPVDGKSKVSIDKEEKK